MTSTAPRVWTDAMTLRAMSLIDNDGLSYEQVATIMARETGVPMTRSTISGLVSRIRHADAAVPDMCQRPENQDGGWKSIGELAGKLVEKAGGGNEQHISDTDDKRPRPDEHRGGAGASRSASSRA